MTLAGRENHSVEISLDRGSPQFSGVFQPVDVFVSVVINSSCSYRSVRKLEQPALGRQLQCCRHLGAMAPLMSAPAACIAS